MIRVAEFTRLNCCPICNGEQLEIINYRTEFAQNARDCFIFEFCDTICNNCGYVFSLNRPSNADLTDYYQGYLKSLSNVSELEIDKRIQILKPYLRDHSHILEIGGGQSGFAKRLTSMGHTVFQEDPSIDSDMEAIEFNGIFDLVCSYYVGEHVLDVNEWVAYQRDLLRSDGHILIEVPDFARHRLESMNNEHINHFQMGHLQHLLIRHGFSIVAASDSDVGRYFGMWVVGKVDGLGSPPPLTSDAVKASRTLLRKVSAELNARKLVFSSIWRGALKMMDDGFVVGFWPCNEITTNILMSSASGFDSSRLRLFDIDSEKHGIDWCSIGRSVQAPKMQALGECSCIYLCSPSYNDQIFESINAMDLKNLIINKVMP